MPSLLALLAQNYKYWRLNKVAGDAVSDGLTYLDIVKHAVKAVMHMLGPHDAVALVKNRRMPRQLC